MPTHCDKEKDDSPELELDLILDNNVEQHLIRTRRLVIVGEISDYLAVYINSYLQFFSYSEDPVYLYISSPGGDMSAGYAIIDQIELSPFPVYTVVRGQANSMAAIIAAYGEKGHRYITKNSSMMMHSISVVAQSESIEPHKSAVDYHDRTYKKKVKNLAKRTLVDYKTLLSLMAETYWMDAKDAIKIGIVDKIFLPKYESYINFNHRITDETRKPQRREKKEKIV